MNAAIPPAPYWPIGELLQIPDLSSYNILNTAEISSDGVITLMSEMPDSQGAVWSTEEFMLDLNKKFQIVMHIYFGDTNEQTSDGFAFALQGHQNFVPYTTQGPSLGVFGENWYGGALGISNSFAIEFDLQENKSADTGNYFDYYVYAQSPLGHHIAYLWPGESLTYQDNNHGSIFNPLYCRPIQHYGTQNVENFTNGEWHKFEINWDPVAERLDYQFSDLEVVSVFNIKEKVGTDRVYWGFTGSTSDASISPQIEFDNIEGLVTSTASMSVYRTVPEVQIPGDGFIYPGEELRFEIVVNYVDGMFEWEDVVFNYLLANEMRYKPESLSLSYSTGEVEKPGGQVWTEKELMLPLLNMDAVRNSVKIVFFADVILEIQAGTQISHWFQVSGQHESIPLMEYRHVYAGESNPTVRLQIPDMIVLTGADPFYVVEGMWNDLNPSQLSMQYFINGNLIESGSPFVNDINIGAWTFTGITEHLEYGENILTIAIQNSAGVKNTTAVQIYLQSKPVLSWGDYYPSENIVFGEKIEIQFHWRDKDSSILDIYMSVNGEDAEIVETLENLIPGTSKMYSFTLSTFDLRLGENQIEIYAENPYENRSNILSFALTTYRALVFSSPPEMLREAETAELSGKSKTYKLISSPIQVLDSRETGAEWNLSVRLESEFGNDNGKVIMDFFYRDEYGAEIQITPENSIVLSHTTENAEVIELRQDGETGFYVRLPPGYDVGSYHVSLHWTLG